MIYGVVSDLHAHNWSIFSKTDPDGVNSRLRIILDELERAADRIKQLGGDHMVIAGDIFHARGTLDPEVLNPVRETIEKILFMGINIDAIPGNHDLKSRETRELSSSIQNLAQINMGGNMLCIHNKPTHWFGGSNMFLGFVPWCETHEELHAGLKEVARLAGEKMAKTDVFIHAGIDGVLSGAPASGLTAADLAKYGFRRVFAGHYHNHADLGDGIYSIGATTHQNWGDVDTRAGFLTVESSGSGPGGVTFNDSFAPKFEDISELDEMEMEVVCKGSYVRFKGPEMTQQEIELLRKQLTDWGALGISIQVPKAIAQRTAAAPVKGLSLDQTVEKFVDDSTTIPASVDKAAVKKRAAEVLRSVREVVEEA